MFPWSEEGGHPRQVEKVKREGKAGKGKKSCPLSSSFSLLASGSKENNINTEMREEGEICEEDVVAKCRSRGGEREKVRLVGRQPMK